MRIGHARSVLAGVVAAVALISAWHEARPTWRQLDDEYDKYSAYSPGDRDVSPITGAGFPLVGSDLFTFVAPNLRRGDRVYFQVPRTRYGTLDLHDTVAAIGCFFFLPAVEVRALDRATVVFSYNAEPGRLHRRFVSQMRWGSGYLSRLAYP